MASDAQTIATLRLDVARLRADLAAALVLERFWRVRALLGHFPKNMRPEAAIAPSHCVCGRPIGHPGRHMGHGGRPLRALKASGAPGGQAPRPGHDP